VAEDDLRQLALDLGRVAAHVEDKMVPVIVKGALNIKNQMRDEAKGHPFFKKLPGAITYSVSDKPGAIEAEIGPRRGVLAGIAYFGSSKPGGRTVPDPKGALETEGPKVEQQIADIIDRGFWQ
jgi:hypothetical protein